MGPAGGGWSFESAKERTGRGKEGEQREDIVIVGPLRESGK